MKNLQEEMLPYPGSDQRLQGLRLSRRQGRLLLAAPAVGTDVLEDVRMKPYILWGGEEVAPSLIKGRYDIN
jgi:hypothetical protein